MREAIDVIELGEVEVYLEDVGPEEAPAIVVLHGGPGGSSYPLREGIGEELEAFRVLYLDQRGSGRSPELPAETRLFTVDALVEDLEALREHLEIDSWALLGHGFGAIPALEYARQFPQTAQSLVLINPWTNFPWLSKQLYRASLELRGMSAADIEVETPDDPTALLNEAFASVEPKAVFDHLMFPSAHSRMEYEWTVEGEGIVGAHSPGQMFVRNGLWRLDYTPYLVQVRPPLTVIVGDRDGTAYPEAQTAADLTGGGLEVLAGAGHYPWIDEPYALAEALLGSLEELE
ncbi:MAG: proline iminopeptidase [Meiothermus sp.]|mgnify:CR=1 FL=1